MSRAPIRFILLERDKIANIPNEVAAARIMSPVRFVNMRFMRIRREMIPIVSF